MKGGKQALKINICKKMSWTRQHHDWGLEHFLIKCRFPFAFCVNRVGEENLDSTMSYAQNGMFPHPLLLEYIWVIGKGEYCDAVVQEKAGYLTALSIHLSLQKNLHLLICGV